MINQRVRHRTHIDRQTKYDASAATRDTRREMTLSDDVRVDFGRISARPLVVID